METLCIISETEKPLEPPEDWKPKKRYTNYPVRNIVRYGYEQI